MTEKDTNLECQENDEMERKVMLIVDSIYRSNSIKNALRNVQLEPRVFSEWLIKNPIWMQRFRVAKEFKAEVMADEIIEIADDFGDPIRARNQIDARKWLASKLKPTEYGDRIDVNVTQTLSISDALAEARKRTLPMRDLDIEAHPQMLDSTAVQGIEATGVESVTVEQVLAKLPKDPTKL